MVWLNKGFIVLTLLANSTGLIGFKNYDPLISTSSISEDFNNSEFNVNDFNLVSNVTLIDFYEYCYGDDSKFSLLIYLALPSSFKLTSDVSLNKISISFGSIDYYQKYSLKFLEKEKNVYKFEVVLNNTNKKVILDRLDKNERIYKIGGIELLKQGERNATEFKIGQEAYYKGYAKGINGNSVSTLSRKYEELTTLDLDVHSSYYRFHDNVGDFKQKDLNSVYFSIPNDYLDKYGELTNINAEYYEYRLADIVVIKSNVYETLKDYVGVKTTKDNHPEFALLFDYQGQINTNTEYYTFEGAGFEASDLFLPFEKNNLITILFDGGENGEKEISSEEILNYIYDYDKSYYLGSNYKGISNDLFDGIDEGHKEGYNQINISSLDNENLLIYEGNSSWDRFWNTVFGKNEELEVSLIEKVDSKKNSDEIFIDEDDIDEFNDFVLNSSKNNESTYVLRYSLTDYFTYGLLDYRYGDLSAIGRDGYVSKQSIFLDFDIISLTFEKEGNKKIIPAISNPLDIVSDTTKPENPSKDFLYALIEFLKIVAGVVLIIILIILLNFVFNLLGISFKDIINFLFVKPFKWIASKFKGKKKYKTKSSNKRK